MLANIILLTTYTFSCHSLRHLVGGKLDCFSCTTLGGPRHTAWRGVSKLERTPHALGMGEPDFRGPDRSVYAAGFCRRDQGHSTAVS